MAYYYVKHTGSSTTAGGTTKKTGPFSGLVATAVYGSITNAITYGAGSGDIICVSDAHSLDHGSSTKTWAGPTSGKPLRTQTVDDGACENSAVASVFQEKITSGYDLRLSGRHNLCGLYLDIAGDVEFVNDATNVRTEDCHIIATAGLMFRGTSPAGYRNTFTPINTTLDASTLNFAIGNKLQMVGGAWTATSLFDTNKYYTILARLDGVDLSSLTGQIVNNYGGGTSDGMIDVELHNCKMNSGFSVANETFTKEGQRVSVYGSSSSSAGAGYQFLIEAVGGKVEDQDDSGIHRDDSVAFPSGTKVSASCLTDTNASLAMPFWFKLPARTALLSAASTDTIRVFLTSETPLDDTDVWVNLLHADKTNKHTQIFLTTQNAERMTVASAGTALDTDSSSTWKDGASAIAGSFYKYYIDVDTGANGADCVPTVILNVAIPSTQIYFCVLYDTVA